MGKIKKLKENELIGGTSNTDVYPITHADAVYTRDNEKLSSLLSNTESRISALQENVDKLEDITNYTVLTWDESSNLQIDKPGTYIVNDGISYGNIPGIEVDESFSFVLEVKDIFRIIPSNNFVIPQLIEVSSTNGIHIYKRKVSKIFYQGRPSINWDTEWELISNTEKEIDDKIDTVKQELNSRIDEAGSIKVIWDNVTNPSNMNDFVAVGVYSISGEHTRDNDNLPIANTGSGHTFYARLTVLDSSIERTEGELQSDDKCITQLLTFSNRLGQGEVYIRTGKGKTLDSLTWNNWSTLQRNVNVGQVESFNKFVDNGIYSGVYMQPPGIIFLKATMFCVKGSIFLYDTSIHEGTRSQVIADMNNYLSNANLAEITDFVYSQKTYTMASDIFQDEYCELIGLSSNGDVVEVFRTLADKSKKYQWANWVPYYIPQRGDNISKDYYEDLSSRHETFVVITINNYAIASAYGVNASCTQLKYSVTVSGDSEVAKRTGTKNITDGVDTWDWSNWENLGSSYTLPIATTDTLGGIKATVKDDYITASVAGENYFDVVVDKRGKAFAALQRADHNKWGVVQVDSSVNPESNNPVSGKAVAEYIAEAIATAITNILNTAV